MNSGIREFMADRSAVCAVLWQGSGRPAAGASCFQQGLFNFGMHAAAVMLSRASTTRCRLNLRRVGSSRDCAVRAIGLQDRGFHAQAAYGSLRGGGSPGLLPGCGTGFPGSGRNRQVGFPKETRHFSQRGCQAAAAPPAFLAALPSPIVFAPWSVIRARGGLAVMGL